MASAQNPLRSAGLFISWGLWIRLFTWCFPTEGSGLSADKKVGQQRQKQVLGVDKSWDPIRNNTDLLHTKETLVKGTGNPSGDPRVNSHLPPVSGRDL